MLFSVVIPVFNRRDLLRRTLDTVRAQTFTDFETIVVDDGSTDGTAEYLARSAGRAQVIRQDNRGPGAARNAGVAHAAGSYVAFLDSDDLWFPWTLEALARAIEAAAGPSLMAARYIDFAEERLLNGVHQTPLRWRRFDDFFSSSHQPIAAGAGVLVVDRSMFLAAGGFTNRVVNGEDIDLVLRLGEAPGFVQVSEPITVGWRRHQARETGNVRRSIDGMNFLIDQERSGRYPGGRSRALERQRIITRQVRPITFACLRAGRWREGMQLYRATARWHAADGRWRYLGGFPVLSASRAVRSGWRR